MEAIGALMGIASALVSLFSMVTGDNIFGGFFLVAVGCWTRVGDLEKRLPVGKENCVKLGDSTAPTEKKKKSNM